MKRYIKLFIALSNRSVKKYLENRANAFVKMSSSLLSVLIYIFYIEIIFYLVTNIQGWNKYQIFLLTGIYEVVIALFTLFFLRSVYMIPRFIQIGFLDTIITKPVNSQFFTSFRDVRPYEVFNVLTGLVLIYYSITKLNLDSSLFNWVILLVGLLAGLIILYSIYFCIATLAIWLVQVNALTNMYHILVNPLSIPIDILGKGLSFFLTYVIPLGFVITVPLKVFLGKAPLYFVFFGVLFAALFLGFSI